MMLPGSPVNSSTSSLCLSSMVSTKPLNFPENNNKLKNQGNTKISNMKKIGNEFKKIRELMDQITDSLNFFFFACWCWFACKTGCENKDKAHGLCFNFLATNIFKNLSKI